MRRSRERQTLVLLELVIMLMVFAVFAAVCTRIFAAAKETSQSSINLRRATEWALSAAECYKATDGDIQETAEIMNLAEGSDGSFIGWKSSNWTDANAEEFLINIKADNGCALISVTQDTEVLISLEVWVAMYGD